MTNESKPAAMDGTNLKNLTGYAAIDGAREYLVQFMYENFGDRTFSGYIRGTNGDVSLAGDFAFEIASSIASLTEALRGRQEEIGRLNGELARMKAREAAQSGELPAPFFYYRSEADGSVRWGEDCVACDDAFTGECDDAEFPTHGGKVYSEAQMLAALARPAIPAPPSNDIGTEQRIASLLCAEPALSAHKANQLAYSIMALLPAPAAPQAVPAPAMTQFAYIATDLDGRADVGLTPEKAKERAGYGCDTIIPLYDMGDAAPQAVPAARELTDAEIREIADDFKTQYKFGGTTYDEFDAQGFARAIERHLSGAAPAEGGE